MRFAHRALVILATYGITQFAHFPGAHAQATVDAPQAQEEPLAWSISASPSDPLQNTLTPSGGVAVVYLWLCRTSTGLPPCLEGLASAQFGLSASPGGPVILGTNMVNGFSNSGTSTCLQLSVSNCPEGPIVAAQILILSLPGNICFIPCNDQDPSNPLEGGVGCADPTFYSMGWNGLNLGGGPCAQGFSCADHIDFFGGCCLPDGTCLNPSSFCTCKQLGGELTGCNPGACCLPDGTCVDVVDGCECIKLGGEYMGQLSKCESVECETVATEPTSWGQTKAFYR